MLHADRCLPEYYDSSHLRRLDLFPPVTCRVEGRITYLFERFLTSTVEASNTSIVTLFRQQYHEHCPSRWSRCRQGRQISPGIAQNVVKARSHRIFLRPWSCVSPLPDSGGRC